MKWKGLNWLKNKVKSGSITVKSPEGNDVSLEIMRSKVKLKPKLVNEGLSVSVEVNIITSLAGLRSNEGSFLWKPLNIWRSSRNNMFEK